MRSVKLEQAKEVTKLRQEVEQGAKELASKYERKMKVSPVWYTTLGKGVHCVQGSVCTGVRLHDVLLMHIAVPMWGNTVLTTRRLRGMTPS